MKLPLNKNTTRMISLFSCLFVISSMGCSTFAGYATLSSGTLSLPLQQEDGQKNLAEFGQRLGTRLAGVWQEIRGLAGERWLTAQTFSLPSTKASTQQSFTGIVDFDDDFWNVFSDVEQHPQARFISLLAKEGIVVGQKGKFYPDNYLRLYDLIKMTVDLYRHKVGYALTGDEWLLQEGYFLGTASLPSRYLSTASRLWFLSHISWNFVDMDDFQRFVHSEDLIQMMSNVAYQFSGMVRVSPLDHQERVTRANAIRYLVVSFDVGSSSNGGIHTPFLDIYGHPFASQITTLEQLGIISSDSQYFHPDNYLHRYDFIIMMVNAALIAEKSTLSANYLSSGYQSSYVDILSTGSYAPFVYYAEDHNWLSYLTLEKRAQKYLLPDTLISMHEVYTVLSKVTGKSFVYDITRADATFMTRAEFAALLCDVFGFTLSSVQQMPASSPSLLDTGGLVQQLSTLLQIKELLAKL